MLTRTPLRSPQTLASSSRAAFTLVELLVVIAIVAVLAGMGVRCCGAMQKKGAMVREIAAGKTLVTAAHAYAADHNGELMAGLDRSITSVVKPDGTTVSSEAAARYPFRMAPYLDWSFQGSIFVNRNEAQIQNKRPVGMLKDYYTSLYPAFGMNYYYIGGLRDNEGITFGEHVLTRLNQTEGSLVIFISAGDSSAGVDGYCILTPPHLDASFWASAEWSKSSRPGSYGNVDARYDGKAVSVFLDGSVKLLTIRELRDMRLWSKDAYASNNPDYQIYQ